MPNEVKLSTSDVHVLDVCCKIEESCALLYHYFSKLYAETPKASELWEKTAREEENHAEQFRLACRIQGSGMESLKIDSNKATTLHAGIQSVYEGVQKNPPTLKEALRFAIKLEQSMAAYHMSAVANFKERGLERLFASMMRCDKQHIEMLVNELKELEAHG